MTMSRAAAEAFERFWAAYPRRPDNPKAAAREVFRRRVQAGFDPEAIVRAAVTFAAEIRTRGVDLKFVPHARTWLSQRRYEDYLETVPASAAEQPSPEQPHALDWLRREIGDDAFRSWIEPLRVEQLGQVLVITARTQFALDQVRLRFGRRLEGQVEWRVAQRAASS